MLKGLLTRREQAVLIFIVASLFIGGGATWWQRHRASAITVTHDEGSMVGFSAEDRALSEDPVLDPRATSGDSTVIVVPGEAVATESGMRPGEITVSVAGAVNTPGVYRVSVSSVVEDAVVAAGGYSDDADPAGINRAAKLIDGTTLNVPEKPTIYARGDSGPVLKMPSPARNILAYLPGSVSRATSGLAPLGGDAASPARKVNINTASSEELQTLPRIGPRLAAAIIEHRSSQPFSNIEDIQDVPKIGPKTFAGLKHMITVSGG